MRYFGFALDGPVAFSRAKAVTEPEPKRREELRLLPGLGAALVAGIRSPMALRQERESKRISKLIFDRGSQKRKRFFFLLFERKGQRVS